VSPCEAADPCGPPLHSPSNRLIYKLLHKRHLPPVVEVAVPLAGAYSVYLCTGVLGRTGSWGWAAVLSRPGLSEAADPYGLPPATALTINRVLP
jgi:hypothetical protein